MHAFGIFVGMIDCYFASLQECMVCHMRKALQAIAENATILALQLC